MKFPIRFEQELRHTMKAVVDTGAAMTLGDLPYHLAVTRLFPELVHKVVNEEESKTADWKIVIGGVQAEQLVGMIGGHACAHRRGQDSRQQL